MREYPLDFVQLTYNILDREPEERLLPLARDRGIAVMVNRPFRAQAKAWAPPVAGRSSARQEAALIGPIERQIEFGEARRSELDGLPAVQDHLDQLGAQKGEVDQAPDIATGDAVALGQLLQ